jgi:hypothetical protein
MSSLQKLGLKTNSRNLLHLKFFYPKSFYQQQPPFPAMPTRRSFLTTTASSAGTTLPI